MPEPQDLPSWLSSQTWVDFSSEVLGAEENAYVHPYGFIVVRLPIFAFPGWGIRVHIWPGRDAFDRFAAQRRTIDQRVHSHGWTIWTKVLLGKVEQVSYVLADVHSSDTGPTWDAYGVASDIGVGKSVLRRLDQRLRPKEVSTEIRSAVDPAFLLPVGQFHETRPFSNVGYAVTLAATEEVQGNASRVLAPSESAEELVNRRESLPDLYSVVRELDAQYSTESPNDRWVSFVYLENDSAILVARTHRYSSFWHPVGGQAEPSDEDPLATAIREVREETGIVLDRKDLRPVSVSPRDRGPGNMYVWSARVGSREVRVQTEELIEVRWESHEGAMNLPMLPAARAGLLKLCGRGE